jgi:Uma2 family endonuclease
MMVISSPKIPALSVQWEKLPSDFLLPEDPVENTDQPLLAAALREALEQSGWLTSDMLVASNFALTAKLAGKTIVKAPDWVYIPNIVTSSEPRRSYAPYVEGGLPAVVMEFLSESDGGEYSTRPIYPYGKWFFYEQILHVPVYVIFEPISGTLEVQRFISGCYELQQADEGRYWLPEMELFLGVWQGKKADRSGNWLRWWNRNGEIVLWGVERVEQERQRAEQERHRAEQERHRAEQERHRADRLAARLLALGVEVTAMSEDS